MQVYSQKVRFPIHDALRCSMPYTFSMPVAFLKLSEKQKEVSTASPIRLS